MADRGRYKSFIRWSRETDAGSELAERQDFVQEIVNNQTFITNVTNNEEFITQIIENNEFVTQLVTNETFVTELTENNEFITQLTENNTYVTSVTNVINGKKGQANELATLGAGGQHTPAEIPPGTLTVVFDGGAAAIAAGLQADLQIPFACTLTGWTLLADPLEPAVSCSIQIDIWKDTYANYPPTVADSIVGGGGKPAISAGVKATDAAITDWAGEVIAAGSILRFNADSATDTQRATLILTYQRS